MSFFGKNTSLVSEKFHLRRIDLQIIECLFSDPRMTFLNIARTLGCSQKTIIRRIEKLISSRVFSILLHTRSSMTMDVMKEVSYSELNDYILRFLPFVFHNRVFIVFPRYRMHKTVNFKDDKNWMHTYILQTYDSFGYSLSS
jgi:hypothetical protein